VATLRLLWLQRSLPMDTVVDAVVDCSLLALVACASWAWLAVLAVLREAWQGRPAGAAVTLPRRLRQLVLVACGVAVAGALAQSASAVPGRARDPLDGLPLPERAVGAAHASPARASATRTRVTVRAGDCLWSLASDNLGADAPIAAVQARWRRIYRLNKAVIGPDPELIRPGQILQLPPSR
jgi:hypothetical protein